MSELSEAAERLLKGPRAYRDRKHSEQADLQAVADAWLEEHDADENEPLTKQWFEEIAGGFLFLSLGGSFRIEFFPQRKAAFLVYEFAFQENRQDEPCEYSPIKTRGQLRTLCRALGIELQETRDG